MSERREFVKVERMGDKARYSVEIPITTETIHNRMDELEQRISDVNDANLYSVSQLEERIDALERRIDAIERKLNHKGVDGC
jgi:polyhydroxyalkanoate synthesis regulator phasin